MRVAIAGAGIAGLACASRLVDMGFEVQVFDKGRKPGGRLSTKTFERWAWDYGAQYFTVRSRGFAEWVAGRMRDDCIAAWKNGPPHAFVGVPGMASLVEDLCTGRDVSFGVTIQRCERTREGWRLYSPGCVCGPFDAVILAIPAEQAMPLIALQDLDMARSVVAARTLPCWTLMLGFAEPLAGLPDYLRGIEPIAWAARNNSKSGRPDGEAWVVQAAPGWSQAHLECEADWVASRLLELFGTMTGMLLPAPAYMRAHRWRFAMTARALHAPLWNREILLGACGDWCRGARVEDAWLAGNAMADALQETVSTIGSAAGRSFTVGTVTDRW